MTPERKREFLMAQSKFIKGEKCNFPGYDELKKNFDAEKTNLGTGCSRCKMNAIKRRYIMKIQSIFNSLP